MNQRPALLLKARPTPTQLADRWRAPAPDGLELYLDLADVRGPDWLDRLRHAWEASQPPAAAAVLVEGPIRSLDGRYFDLTRSDRANHELADRLIQAAQVVNARAINIHCVAPSHDPRVVSEAARQATLERALPFVQVFVAACGRAGVLPLIENIPPVGRMREGAFMYSPIGVEAQDLAWLTDAVPGLGITLDTSHAQLAINAASGRVGGDATDAALKGICAAYASRPHPLDLVAYVEQAGPAIVSAHISNARGLLGEGLPYDDGDADLDRAVRALAERAAYLVTEPLEPNPEQADLMRDCWRRMQAALAVDG